jgi:hypothetical protein
MIFNEIMTKYWSNEIDKQSIQNLYQNRVNTLDLTQSLNIAFSNKDKSSLENCFFVAYTLNLFSIENEAIISKLIVENWHKEHEDIVGLFQRKFNNNKQNIQILLQAINNIPEYLQDDDFKYPYIRKLIYAIGAQLEKDNIETLLILAKSEDEQIGKLALHQIKKRKELGRWENEQ